MCLACHGDWTSSDTTATVLDCFLSPPPWHVVILVFYASFRLFWPIYMPPYPDMCRYASYCCPHGGEAWCVPTLHELKMSINVFVFLEVHIDQIPCAWIRGYSNIIITLVFNLSKCQSTIPSCRWLMLNQSIQNWILVTYNRLKELLFVILTYVQW